MWWVDLNGTFAGDTIPTVMKFVFPFSSLLVWDLGR